MYTCPLARDQEQSHRLHEPDHLVNTIDPITGCDIWNLAEHPSIVDGNLTIYFESEETKSEYEHTPVNHRMNIRSVTLRMTPTGAVRTPW